LPARVYLVTSRGSTTVRWNLVPHIANAIALDATSRLAPDVMAQVDPQAFWSAVLHYKKFVETLGEHYETAEVAAKWENLRDGIDAAHEEIKECENLMDQKLWPNESGTWDLRAEEDLERLSLLGVKAALSKVIPRGLELFGSPETAFSLQLMADYRGTELERATLDLMEALHGGDVEDASRVCRLLEVGLPSNSFRECVTCGRTSELNYCARCNCVSYCSLGNVSLKTGRRIKPSASAFPKTMSSSQICRLRI
jgi:hypothetical protein